MFLGKKVTVIVAYMLPSGAIGLKNKLLIECKEDMKNFRITTTKSVDEKQNVVVMGRKTYESMGLKPLSNRINVVFSTSKINDNVITVNIKDFYHKISLIKNINEIFVIGGRNIYDLFFEENIVDIIIATEYTEKKLMLMYILTLKNWINSK